MTDNDDEDDIFLQCKPPVNLAYQSELTATAAAAARLLGQQRAIILDPDYYFWINQALA
jgi:hypothetical protein